MATINPYLNFGGNCEEAFRFYHAVFGGELVDLTRFKDMPSEGGPDPSEADWLMHVALPIGDGTILMGSDVPRSMGEVVPGNNVHISLQPKSAEEATRLFDGLAAGGQVTMPLTPAPWGATFGMFVDRFGIHWMVNYQE